MLNNSKEINEIYSQIGEKISQARKSSKRKIDPISKKLKINLFYLKKIEDGDFENIPEGIYIRGYLKSYAKFLNIDILVELKNIDKILNKKNTSGINVLENPLPSKLLIYFMTFACVLAIVMFIFTTKENEINTNLKSENNENKKNLDKNLLNEYSENNVMDLQKEYQDLTHNPDEDITGFSNDYLSLNEKTVELAFFEETWIQIFDQNNVLHQSGLFNNESLFLKVDEKNSDYVIDTGNLGGFKVLFNGKVLKKIGQSGEVKKKILLSTLLKELKKKSY